MACSCTGSLSECIKVYVNPCDAGIPLDLLAPVAGDYLILLTGANTAKKFVITLEQDEEIVLPNDILNNYVYELQIFKPSGELLNDTCYTLRTILTMGISSSILPPTPITDTKLCDIQVYISASPDTSQTTTLCNGDVIQYQYASGNTLQILDADGNPYMVNLNIVRPVFLASIVNQTMDYNSVTGEFDNSAEGGFSPDSLFTVQAYLHV